MSKSEQIQFQELAERFKRLKLSFVDLKIEIKAKLKELEREEVSKSVILNLWQSGGIINIKT